VPVFTPNQGRLEEFDCRLLLESKSVSNPSNGLDQQNDGEWKVGLCPEIRNGLWLAVFVYLEIVLVETRYEFAFFVGDREEHVYQIDISR
jgi:hypothetical protein